MPKSVLECIPAAANVDAPLRVLALDGLTDAANVGSQMRIAAAFGVTAVLCSAACCDPFHSKAVRTSAGQVFQVPVFRGDLPTALQELRTRGVVTAAAIVQ